MKKYYGVLGLEGTIGHKVIEYLLNMQDEKILANTRNMNSISEMNNVEMYLFDIKDGELLKSFLSKCHTVINCTGFTSNVASICLDNDVNYIDVCGDRALVDKLKLLSSNFKEKRLLCMHSVGSNPGLTEAFVRHISNIHSPEEVEVYFSGSGELSINAIKEIMRSSCEDISTSGSYINNKKITNMNILTKEKILPNPVNKAFCVPLINKSFFECITNCTFNVAFFFNSFKSKDIIYSLIKAKINKNVLCLKEDFDKYNTLFKREFTMLHIIYKKNNQISETGYLYTLNWNDLTSLIVVITAISILNNKIKLYGVGEIWNSIDLDWFFDELYRNKNIKIY